MRQAILDLHKFHDRKLGFRSFQCIELKFIQIIKICNIKFIDFYISINQTSTHEKVMSYMWWVQEILNIALLSHCSKSSFIWWHDVFEKTKMIMGFHNKIYFLSFCWRSDMYLVVILIQEYMLHCGSEHVRTRSPNLPHLITSWNLWIVNV